MCKDNDFNDKLKNDFSRYSIYLMNFLRFFTR